MRPSNGSPAFWGDTSTPCLLEAGRRLSAPTAIRSNVVLGSSAGRNERTPICRDSLRHTHIRHTLQLSPEAVASAAAGARSIAPQMAASGELFVDDGCCGFNDAVSRACCCTSAWYARHCRRIPDSGGDLWLWTCLALAAIL